MFDVTFTDSFESDSSAVDAAYYNQKDRTLVVDLHNSLYKYEGVGQYTWDNFKNATSKGRYYIGTIKPNYGPSEFLGFEHEADYDEVENTYEAADFGPVGTPKNLTYAENAVVDGVSAASTRTDNYLSLTPASNAEAAPEGYRTGVTFETPHGTKKHEVFATSALDARFKVEELASVLGVTVTVKEATVYFE